LKPAILCIIICVLVITILVTIPLLHFSSEIGENQYEYIIQNRHFNSVDYVAKLCLKDDKITQR